MLVTAAFHYVRPSFEQPYPGVFGVTPQQLRSQLVEMGRYAPFISQSDLRFAVENRVSLPERGWLITFDDGLREQYEHAWPVLREMGIPAIFFVNTAPIAEESVALVHKIHILRSYVAPGELEVVVRAEAERAGLDIEGVNENDALNHYIYDTPDVARIKFLLNFGLAEADRERIVNSLFDHLIDRDEADVSRQLYMSREQVADLAGHDAIGSHTHTHRCMGLLDEEEMVRDVTESLHHLQLWCGRRIDSLSYPYGSKVACPPAAGRAAARSGVRFAFTMERAGCVSLENPMFIPRAADNDIPGGRASRWDGGAVFDQISLPRWGVDNR